MTREEIIKESQEYAILKAREKEALCGVYTDIQEAFLAGAEFVYEHPINVWHDINEEPQGYYWKILCQDEEGGCWVENRANAMLSHNTWNEYIETEMVVRWAYIKDLQPKN